MIRMPASKARDDFSGTLNRVAFGGERVVLRRHGKDVAAVVSMEDLEILQRLEDRADVEAARAALAEAREQGTVPWEQVKANLGL